MFFWSVDSAFRNFLNFFGRSGRAEFWYWILYANLFISLSIFSALLIAPLHQIDGALSLIYAPVLAILVLPSLAVTVRRLHDIGRSGWWIWIYFVPAVGFLLLLYFCVQPSTAQPNRYGAVPQPGSAT